jgi:hypothetical protein
MTDIVEFLSKIRINMLFLVIDTYVDTDIQSQEDIHISGLDMDTRISELDSETRISRYIYIYIYIHIYIYSYIYI